MIDSAGAPVETAPWFDQPGGGEQYQLDGSPLPGGPARPHVKYLINNGDLQPLN